MKELLQQLLARPIAFHPALARAAGGAAAGLFLSQLFYWCDKGGHPDGWIYKDADEWERETCLTRAEQRTARNALRGKGLIEESDVRKLKINQFGSTLAYRINWTNLEAALIAAQPGKKDAA